MSILEIQTTPRTDADEPRPSPQLAGVFGSHMVLQCERPIRVWGTSVPGDAVQIALAANTAIATADDLGRFEAELPPLPAGGPFELIVTGAEGSTVLEDVMLGEVWLCCGQSNMAWPVRSNTDADQIIQDATPADIRMLRMPGTEGVPGDTMASWQRCSPETVRDFSAVGYLAGRRLHDVLQRPVGLILAAWSGSHIEAWMSRDALMSDSVARQDVLDFEASRNGDYSLFAAPVSVSRTEWASSTYDDRHWPLMALPDCWQNAGHFHHGVMWFRRSIDVPSDWAGRDLDISLGKCADEGEFYFNGKIVGVSARDTSGATPSSHLRCTVRGALVNAGINTLAVRVTGYREGGGISGRPADMFAKSIGALESRELSLAGIWRYQFEAKAPMRRVPVIAWLADARRGAYALFDSLIAPLIPFTLRGVLWYQGEQNAWQAARYGALFRRLIRDWRARWRLGAFPFVFVQLPNMQGRNPNPSESDKAELREAQAQALSEPSTAMAVAIDCGEVDFHPRDKRVVAQRLANAALAVAYQHPVHSRGPRYRSHRRDGNVITVELSVEAGPLRTRDGDTVTGFAIAGADRRFEWATAIPDGCSVSVWSPRVPEPVAVRYAWANNPNCNLCDSEGLPLAPFRTDRWPQLTSGESSEDHKT